MATDDLVDLGPIFEEAEGILRHCRNTAKLAEFVEIAETVNKALKLAVSARPSLQRERRITDALKRWENFFEVKP